MAKLSQKEWEALCQRVPNLTSKEWTALYTHQPFGMSQDDNAILRRLIEHYGRKTILDAAEKTPANIKAGRPPIRKQVSLFPPDPPDDQADVVAWLKERKAKAGSLKAAEIDLYRHIYPGNGAARDINAFRKTLKRRGGRLADRDLKRFRALSGRKK